MRRAIFNLLTGGSRMSGGEKLRRLARAAAFTTGGATLLMMGMGPFQWRELVALPLGGPILADTQAIHNGQAVQASVVSPTKHHSLFLTIHLKSGAKHSEIVKALAGLNEMVDKICPPDLRDEDDELLVGVGFGPNFLRRIHPEAFEKGLVENFTYEHRKGGEADMPSTGGDIFIHAKCNEQGKLFELCQGLLHGAMPDQSVASFEEIYSWVYQNGRDLSGFIDGTENPAAEDDRLHWAVNSTTGGSYVITQRWIHKHDVIKHTKDAEMEKWIGRRRADSVALASPKPLQSHVARVTGSLDGKTKKFNMVRQSQPYGTVSGDSGLFFIAYARSPQTFNYMLDRMAGVGEASTNYDHVFKLSSCVSGSYFYVPSVKELARIYAEAGAGGSKTSGKLW